tara:strand:+ start:1491 stop:2318 length:828 start_codon:yes stop_codon:yes gene_type:complete
MIRFFRKIRYDLMEKNPHAGRAGKTAKYLKYAIGEIVLVMIGILLALQVNTWNINRNNAKQEIAILSQLENEYEENLKEVNEKISMRYAMQSSIKTIFTYMDNGIDGVSLDTIRKHIGRTYKNPTFDGPNGVTQEILSSGKLYLIQNLNLKIHLSNWKNTTQKVVEEEQLLVNQNSNFYYEYLIQNYDFGKMSGSSLNDKEIEIYNLSDETNQNDYRIGGKNDESEYKKFLNDITISNYLRFTYGHCLTANTQSIGLKQKIERILEIIRNDLENK